jgi:hypothetical protein
MRMIAFLRGDERVEGPGCQPGPSTLRDAPESGLTVSDSGENLRGTARVSLGLLVRPKTSPPIGEVLSDDALHGLGKALRVCHVGAADRQCGQPPHAVRAECAYGRHVVFLKYVSARTLGC